MPWHVDLTARGRAHRTPRRRHQFQVSPRRRVRRRLPRGRAGIRLRRRRPGVPLTVNAHTHARMHTHWPVTRPYCDVHLSPLRTESTPHTLSFSWLGSTRMMPNSCSDGVTVEPHLHQKSNTMCAVGICLTNTLYNTFYFLPETTSEHRPRITAPYNIQERCAPSAECERHVCRLDPAEGIDLEGALLAWRERRPERLVQEDLGLVVWTRQAGRAVQVDILSGTMSGVSSAPSASRPGFSPAM